MKKMFKKVTALVACLLCVTVLSAQTVDRTVARSIENFFTNYSPKNVFVKNCGLERRRNNIVVNKSARKITIYANQNFAAQVFTPAVVKDIYASNLVSHNMFLLSKRKEIFFCVCTVTTEVILL